MYFRIFFVYLAFCLLPLKCLAAFDEIQLNVWVNEAIVATYTYDDQNLLKRQQEIAKYFTANGWIAYSKAQQDAKLLEDVQKNMYHVSAVATMPPSIKKVNAKQWEASMPLLVVYKNPQYQQKQTLNVTITIIEAPPGQGVRGFAISSMQSKIAKPMCQCTKEERYKAIV